VRQGGSETRAFAPWLRPIKTRIGKTRAAAWRAFQRLVELTPDAIGAATDELAPVPCLRFDENAQGVFNEGVWPVDIRIPSCYMIVYSGGDHVQADFDPRIYADVSR
jgi:hypothetical protein